MDEDRGDGPSAFHRPQKPVDHPVHFRRVEQERVMAERAFKLDKADRRTRRIERVDDLTRFPGGIEPVGIEGYHAKARVRALERIVEQSATLLRAVKIITRPVLVALDDAV